MTGFPDRKLYKDERTFDTALKSYIDNRQSGVEIEMISSGGSRLTEVTARRELQEYVWVVVQETSGRQVMVMPIANVIVTPSYTLRINGRVLGFSIELHVERVYGVV